MAQHQSQKVLSTQDIKNQEAENKSPNPVKVTPKEFKKLPQKKNESIVEIQNQPN